MVVYTTCLRKEKTGNQTSMLRDTICGAFRLKLLAQKLLHHPL